MAVVTNRQQQLLPKHGGYRKSRRSTAKQLGPLPANWEMRFDKVTGQAYFVDHNTKSTSWVDPRQIGQRPTSFDSCHSGELPLGWEKAFDPIVGVYYIDHNTWTTHLDAPWLNQAPSSTKRNPTRAARHSKPTRPHQQHQRGHNQKHQYQAQLFQGEMQQQQQQQQKKKKKKKRQNGKQPPAQPQRRQDGQQRNRLSVPEHRQQKASIRSEASTATDTSLEEGLPGSASVDKLREELQGLRDEMFTLQSDAAVHSRDPMVRRTMKLVKATMQELSRALRKLQKHYKRDRLSSLSATYQKDRSPQQQGVGSPSFLLIEQQVDALKGELKQHLTQLAADVRSASTNPTSQQQLLLQTSMQDEPLSSQPHASQQEHDKDDSTTLLLQRHEKMEEAVEVSRHW